jgi:hypothetical protein
MIADGRDRDAGVARGLEYRGALIGFHESTVYGQLDFAHSLSPTFRLTAGGCLG